MIGDRFKMLLSAYVDGEVAPGERTEIESHLTTCQGCSTELSRLRRLKDLFSHLEVKEPAPGFRDRLQARLEAAQRGTPFWNRLKTWILEQFPRPLTYAFLLLALLIGNSFIFWGYQSLKGPEPTGQMQLSQAPSFEDLYAEDILFDPALSSSEGEDLLSFNMEVTPFEDLLEGFDIGG